MTIQPIFVVGSPRSGTTLVGKIISSLTGALDTAEFGGFYLATYLAKRALLGKRKSDLSQTYIKELGAFTQKFINDATKRAGKKLFCESTPSNILANQSIMDLYPRAVFVIVLRHYIGVIQSLERSYAGGYDWAGSQIQDRALIWANHYFKSLEIPQDRIIIISYDLLCQNPEFALKDLYNQLRCFGFTLNNFDLSIFVKSYAACSGQTRNTIGRYVTDEIIQLRRIESIDRKKWTAEHTQAVSSITAGINKALCARFASHYVNP